MRIYNLLARNLRWYWRTNVPVLLGVATATGVLGGAILVGESVRASLRDIALARLGNVEAILTRNTFVREELASALPGAAPLIALEATILREGGGRVSGVEVYGIDRRYWSFQGLGGAPPAGRDAILTAALARELGAARGDTVLLRVRKISAIPSESLHGRKEDTGRTLRLTVASPSAVEFSLQPRQGELKAVYVPLALLQHELEQDGKANTILLRSDSPHAATMVKSGYTLPDLGLSLRPIEQPGGWALESDSAVISDSLAQTAVVAARSLGLRAEPVLTYLANRIALECSGARGACPEVPYSVVTALESELAPARDDGIVLNDWTARDLGARPGDTVSLDYFVWKPRGELASERARFRVERVVPLAGAAADRTFAPRYPGITDSGSLRDWDPPFPLDLSKVRPADETYWKRYRATPKAFIRLARGRELWATRFGGMTSLRIFPPSAEYGERLRSALDPATQGLTAVPVRAKAMEAAGGATDFGEYFLYFSFFLVVSALLLTGLFFRLGIEQRTREIGVLRSLGFPLAKIRAVFLMEGAVLAATGAAIGVAAALGYGQLLVFGLRTWWIGAVGTQSISLHKSWPGLAWGAAGGIAAGLATVAVTLRSLKAMTPRGLVMGEIRSRPAARRRWSGAAAALLGSAVGYAAWTGKLDETTGFFGAGTLFLAASLLLLSSWLHGGGLGAIRGTATLGIRNLAHRPGRSILCLALIASATFLVVALDSFRRDASSGEGTGGYPLLATSDVPVIHDPNGAAGREALNLPSGSPAIDIVPFRVKPGDDASCQNLYRPLNPRIVAPPAAFLRKSRFAFQGAIREAANPWLLLEEKLPDGAIPVIADANSMTYALHLKLGDRFELNGVSYRLVAALRDSIFQSELLISEANFLRVFPEIEGYRFFLLKTPAADAGEVARELEDALSGYGFDAQPSAARLAGFHEVENTYLSTFRALGGLGLVLGTVGLAAVLLRNVLERRRELALLRAVGYRPAHLAGIVLVENVLLLILGVAIGAVCALLAVVPAVSARGGQMPWSSLAVLSGAVVATGVAASLAATAIALRSPMLGALKSE